jgi:hypothetical protein
MQDNEYIRFKRNLSALVDFSRVINSSLDINFILNNVLLTCLGKFLTTKGFIALNENGKLSLKSYKGIPENIMQISRKWRLMRTVILMNCFPVLCRRHI